MREYTIILERAPNNWAGYVPDLPIVMATGATPEEVTERLKEAIVLHIEALIAHGMPIPEPAEAPEITPAMTSRTIEVPV
jgi:predicted RNase H-like HicB family nuclease